MSVQTMTQVLAQLSEKDATGLARHRSGLLQLGAEIEDQIVGVVYSLPAANGSSALVVTPTRIVELTEGGSIPGPLVSRPVRDAVSVPDARSCWAATARAT